MDKNIEILLGSEKNINSINVDNRIKIELSNNLNELTEYTVNDVVNSTEQFDIERQSNEVYRIYGRIEYLSLMNGMRQYNNNRPLSDFFTDEVSSSSPNNIFRNFDFHMVAPHYDEDYVNIDNTNNYLRPFIVVSDSIDFEVMNAGFTKNIYGEQIYSFSFRIDFDVSDYYDKLGFPLTELYLYAQYVPASNEELYYTSWSTSTGSATKKSLTTKSLYMRDTVEDNSGYNIYDIIEYIPEEFSQKRVTEQTFFIATPYVDNGEKKWLEFSYNPLIPFRLRDFDSVVSTDKLSEIIADGTSLEITDLDNPNNRVLINKLNNQPLGEAQIITNWGGDIESDWWYKWKPEIGVFRIKNTSNYRIKFITKFNFNNKTDRFIGSTVLRKGYGNISGTTRTYSLSNESIATVYEGNISANSKISVLARLIPNPNNRTLFDIPDYAIMLPSVGKYVWRDILPQGYSDPLTGTGVDYPFFNGKRYLFSALILSVQPNVSDNSWRIHQNTRSVFNEINYGKKATQLETKPLTDLDNIGKPCQ